MHFREIPEPQGDTSAPEGTAHQRATVGSPSQRSGRTETGSPGGYYEYRASGGPRVWIPPGPGGRLTGRKRPGVVEADWQSPAPMERRRQPRRLHTACATGPSQPGAGAPLPAPLPLPTRLPLR